MPDGHIVREETAALWLPAPHCLAGRCPPSKAGLEPQRADVSTCLDALARGQIVSARNCANVHTSQNHTGTH